MRGVMTAVITPFTSNDEIDFDSLKKILKDQKDAGVSEVVACGTTGESPTLSIEEKKKVIEFTLSELKGSPTKVIAGTGSNNTRESVELSKWASHAGVDGVLIVTPYYNKPTPAGLELHFTSIADAVTCEVILYNVPGRTNLSMTGATVAKLAKHPRIRTIKEASGNLTYGYELMESVSLSGEKMDFLSGDDATFLPFLSIGGVGTISVASNLFPRAMVELQRLYEKGEVQKALEIHQRYFPLFRDLFVESNPGPIKYAMAEMGFCQPHLRAPLAALTSNSQEKIRTALEQCGIKKGKVY